MVSIGGYERIYICGLWSSGAWSVSSIENSVNDRLLETKRLVWRPSSRDHEMVLLVMRTDCHQPKESQSQHLIQLFI